MKNTKRFTQCEPYINKTISIKGTFSTLGARGRFHNMACIAQVTLPNGEILDHIWVNLTRSIKLRTGRPIKLTVKVRIRKRAPESIMHNEPLLDIAFIQKER